MGYIKGIAKEGDVANDEDNICKDIDSKEEMMNITITGAFSMRKREDGVQNYIKLVAIAPAERKTDDIEAISE